MKRILLFSALIFSVLFSFAVTTNNPPKRIKEINTHTSAIIAPFTETQVMPKMKKTIQKSGMLYYLCPDQLSMTYDEPAGNQTIIFEDMFYIRKENKVQKFQLKQKNSQMAQLRDLLMWSFKGEVDAIAQAHNAKVIPSESPICLSFKLEVKKEQEGQAIQSMLLIYDKISGALLQLRLNKANGNYVIYKTDKPVINEPIDEKVWTMEGVGDVRKVAPKKRK